MALRLGYRIAREAGAQYIATLDGDGQWDPADLPAMVSLLEDGQADFVVGSRQLGRTENTDSFRNLGVRFFARLISLLTRTRLTDTSSGLRAMRADLTAVVRQTQPQYQTSELLIGALFQGFRVAEVPTTMRQRLSGVTKKGDNLFYGLRYARVIGRTWWRERQRAARGPGRRLPARLDQLAARQPGLGRLDLLPVPAKRLSIGQLGVGQFGVSQLRVGQLGVDRLGADQFGAGRPEPAAPGQLACSALRASMPSSASTVSATSRASLA